MSKQAVTKIRGAVCYRRVSSDEQVKHGTSLEAQKDSCRIKAEQLGLPIVAEFADEGISGAFLLSREGLMAALAMIRTGQANTLIVANVSRLSRDISHQQEILKTVRAAGGEIVFVEQEFAQTAEGDLMFSFMGGYAQYERQLFKKRSADGRKRRALEGKMSLRQPPFGFYIPTHLDATTGDYTREQVGTYIVIPEQAEVVRRIFEQYASGARSLHTLARELNAEGVPTPKGGPNWHPSTLKVILGNPVYRGEPCYGKTRYGTDEARLQQINPLTGLPYTSPRFSRQADPAEVIQLSAPPIVSAEVWERAQERTQLNKAAKSGNPNRVYPLSGRIVCPQCGGGMQHKKQPEGRRPNYVCNSYEVSKRAGKEPVCSKNYYSVDKAEEAVILSIAECLSHPEWVQAQLEQAAKRRPQETDSESARKELAAIDRALDELRREEGTIVAAQIAGLRAGASADVYNDLFASLAAKRKGLLDRQGALSQSLKRRKGTEKDGPVDSARVLAETLEAVHTALTSPFLTGAEKRDFIGRIISKVIPRRDGAAVEFLPCLFDSGETVQCSVLPYLRYEGVNRVDVFCTLSD